MDKAVRYVLGRDMGRVEKYVYYVIASALIFLGAGLSADLLWDIADFTMGGMTLINIPVIIFLGKYAVRALDDFVKQRSEGKEPQFRARDIGLPHEVDYWQD